MCWPHGSAATQSTLCKKSTDNRPVCVSISHQTRPKIQKLHNAVCCLPRSQQIPDRFTRQQRREKEKKQFSKFNDKGKFSGPTSGHNTSIFQPETGNSFERKNSDVRSDVFFDIDNRRRNKDWHQHSQQRIANIPFGFIGLKFKIVVSLIFPRLQLQRHNSLRWLNTRSWHGCPIKPLQTWNQTPRRGAFRKPHYVVEKNGGKSVSSSHTCHGLLT